MQASLELCFFSLVPALLFPQYMASKLTGDYKVLTKEYTWIDESRVETYTNTGENREVTIKVFYPEEAGNYPLILFFSWGLWSY